jgi:uncharacterized protein (TIGR02145 family)
METIKIELEIKCGDSKEEIGRRLVERLFSYNNDYNDDYAVINGIKLKRENETLRHCKCFAYKEAIELSESRGLRLPSKKEWYKMLEVGFTWDDKKKGIWIGENHHLKKETSNSTFLPTPGFYGFKGTMVGEGEEGAYWSCSSGDFCLYFNYEKDLSFEITRNNPCISIRCILEDL